MLARGRDLDHVSTVARVAGERDGQHVALDSRGRAGSPSTVSSISFSPSPSSRSGRSCAAVALDARAARAPASARRRARTRARSRAPASRAGVILAADGGGRRRHWPSGRRAWRGCRPRQRTGNGGPHIGFPLVRLAPSLAVHGEGMLPMLIDILAAAAAPRRLRSRGRDARLSRHAAGRRPGQAPTPISRAATGCSCGAPWSASPPPGRCFASAGRRPGAAGRSG